MDTFEIWSDGTTIRTAHKNDEALTIEECDWLRKALMEYRSSLRLEKALASLDSLLLTAEWITMPATRGHRRDLSPCVYFIVNDARPDAVKIGQTINFNARMKSLDRELGSPSLCLAVARHLHIRDLETAFHAYFSRYRIGNNKLSEWFEIKPVQEYLKKIHENLHSE